MFTNAFVESGSWRYQSLRTSPVTPAIHMVARNQPRRTWLHRKHRRESGETNRRTRWTVIE